MIIAETIHFYISWSEAARPQPITIGIAQNKGAITKTIKFTVKEFNEQVIPLFRIVMGIDDIQHALLFFGQGKEENEVLKRMIKEGTDWIKITGLQFNKDGSWYITRTRTEEPIKGLNIK